jgi:hypothetical protein
MKCAVLGILGLMVSVSSWGQIRLNKMVLEPKQVYELKGTDILVVDTLVMKDSSRIILNKLKTDNFIHAKAAIFYRGAMIDGKGVHGIRGRKGRTGLSPSSPCTDGGSGIMGSEGTNGGAGINLFLYFSDITLKGPLTIDVAGGDGGDGGNGGAGGGGGPGTRICAGGNGGNGAAGAKGGDGGRAGSVTISATRIPELRSMIGETIIIRIYGGNLGLGGEGGIAGYSGLSPVGNNKMDGKPGKKGPKGKEGVQGKPGAINFQEKEK